MTLFPVTLVSAIFLMSHTAIAGERAVTLVVETMICGADPHIIKRSLSALPGVSNVAISLEKKTATVTFDDRSTTVDDMLIATASAGYAAVQAR